MPSKNALFVLYYLVSHFASTTRASGRYICLFFCMLCCVLQITRVSSKVSQNLTCVTNISFFDPRSLRKLSVSIFLHRRRTITTSRKVPDRCFAFLYLLYKWYAMVTNNSLNSHTASEKCIKQVHSQGNKDVIEMSPWTVRSYLEWQLYYEINRVMQ